MHAWDRLSAAVWTLLLVRTIGFRARWDGYVWTPNLHADTWYRLTEHRAFPHHKHVRRIWTAELFLLLLATTVAVNTPIACAAHVVRIFATRLWWILFLELGASWTATGALILLAAAADVVIYLEIDRAHIEPLYAPQVALTTLLVWYAYMNTYAVCVVKSPTTRIAYKARSSRLPV